MQSLAALRNRVRALRRALPNEQRRQAAWQLARRVMVLEAFTTARHIAGYLACDGELDPAPLLTQAWQWGKQVYLPVLTEHPETPMLFAPYRPDGALKPNRFGIPEPQVSAGQFVPSRCLDLVLTPLVAFDTRGTRLGMGGGFYDRTFAFRRNPAHGVKPCLLGLAYEFQKVAELTRRPWDIPLDGIITEQALYPGESGCPLD